MNNVIYTIGYTAFDIDSFVQTLVSLGIDCLIDVRSIPIASDFYKIYSKTSLQEILKKHNIVYMNFADEFGARQPDENLYSKYGYLDFETFINTDRFIFGVKRIKKGLSLGHTIVLMCAEKDPIDCHRAIMVSRGLKNYGVQVEHIHFDGSKESHKGLEKRLVDMFFPNREQLNLFETRNFEDFLQDAYRIQNKKIGYVKKD